MLFTDCDVVKGMSSRYEIETDLLFVQNSPLLLVFFSVPGTDLG